VNAPDDLDRTVRDPLAGTAAAASEPRGPAPRTGVADSEPAPRAPTDGELDAIPDAGGPDSLALTTEPSTRRAPTPTPPRSSDAPPSAWSEAREIAREFLHRNEKLLWWAHTAWALSLGAFVATFAQKGFEQARMLTLSLIAAWALVVFFFRLFGTGTQQDFATAWPAARRRFFVVTYLMKNLFQGMLFFLLPFYWKSASFEAGTATPFLVLGGCALVSTLDIVFDRVLLRFKAVASLFFAATAFGCVTLVVPALWVDAPSLVALMIAAGVSTATFVLFHLPLARLKSGLGAGAFVSLVFFAVFASYAGRRAFPALPSAIAEGGIGLAQRADGVLSAEVRTLRLDANGQVPASELFAVTDVSAVGRGDSFHHVWRKGGRELVHQAAPTSSPKDRSRIRVASRLATSALPEPLAGHYAVDVVTDAGQIVGRVTFDIRP
jgi:hypothetical protein